MRFFLGLLLGGGLFLVLEETGLLHDVVGGKVLQRRLVLRHRRPTQVTILVEVEQLGEFDVALVLLPVGKALGSSRSLFSTFFMVSLETSAGSSPTAFMANS